MPTASLHPRWIYRQTRLLGFTRSATTVADRPLHRLEADFSK